MGTHTSDGLDVQAILDAVRHVVQALRESSRLAERQVGLTGAQLFVLQKLAESPALSVNELAERTHTHQRSVSTVVSRLVDRRLVRMQGGDRRPNQGELRQLGKIILVIERLRGHQAGRADRTDHGGQLRLAIETVDAEDFGLLHPVAAIAVFLDERGDLGPC